MNGTRARNVEHAIMTEFKITLAGSIKFKRTGGGGGNFLAINSPFLPFRCIRCQLEKVIAVTIKRC